jgi:Flp pilus assembly protein TadG
MHEPNPSPPLFRRLLAKALCLARAGESGAALAELALMLPIFSVLIVGAAECARLEFAAIEVANAAHAGVQYGAQNYTTAANASGMRSAATSDGSDVTNLSATATTYCTCSNGTSITCADSATSCSARVFQYVQVTASATVNPTFHIPGLPSTYTLQSTAVMRVQ